MRNPLASLFSEFDEIIVFDIETSGLDHKKDHIIDFGLISYTSDSDVENYIINDLVKLPDGRYLPPKITELTGITDAMLESGIDQYQLFDKIYRAFTTPSRKLVVAYNAQFDLSFLYQFLKRFNSTKILDEVSFLDPMTIFKDRASYPHRLINAMNRYLLDDSLENKHRAYDDAKATIEVLKAMADEEDDIINYVNLFGFNPKYGVNYEPIAKVRYIPQSYYSKEKLYNY